MTEVTPSTLYVTAPDRIGLAILAGGLLAGCVAVLLALAGGAAWGAMLGVVGAVGAVAAMCTTVALVGPVWLVLHRLDRRGPASAALTAALLATTVLTLAQLYADAPGGGYRWASAIGTGAVAALVSAAIGVAMQRVAYRRLL